MPEKKTTKKTATNPLDERRAFDAEFESLLGGARIVPAKTADGDPAAPLNVQPPQPEVVSRLVNFLKKI
jgi:hypothetical protein